MRPTLLSIPVLAALAGSAPAFAGCSDATGPRICDRPDQGTPCSAGRTVEPIDGGYLVTTRSPTSEPETYVDGGVVCVFRRFGCEERYCYAMGVRSAEDALAFCE